VRSRWAPPPDSELGTALRTIVNIPAFEFDELRLDWGDVVLAAIGWGEWQLLEQSLAEGLAGADAAEHGDEQLDAGWLRAAVVTFRRARGLVAGDDYLAWLSERSLSPADLEAHLARAGLRERARERQGGVHESDRVHAARITMAIRAEAILSGSLGTWAERLARCAAAARGLAAGADEPPGVAAGADAALAAAAARCPSSGLTAAAARERAAAVTALLGAERAFFDRVITGERIERCLAQHRLGWQRFVWEEVAFASEGAAREASLLVRSDGMTLGEAAGLARTVAEIREAYADDVPELSGLLAATAPGELVGPLAGDGGWRLLRMRERTPPAVSDPVLRERAHGEIVEDALERHLAGRVRRHGGL
jgi:hypothetical protein